MRVLKKNYVGNLGIVLSWSKRKPDYERVRGYCGGDSEWRGPGRLRGPRFFACHLFSSLPSTRYSFVSRIYHPRTSTCAMPRTTSTNNPSDVMNTVPYRTISFARCHVKNSHSHVRYNMTPRPLAHQFFSLSYNVFSTVSFSFMMGLLRVDECDHMITTCGKGPDGSGQSSLVLKFQLQVRVAL